MLQHWSPKLEPQVLCCRTTLRVLRYRRPKGRFESSDSGNHFKIREVLTELHNSLKATRGNSKTASQRSLETNVFLSWKPSYSVEFCWIPNTFPCLGRQQVGQDFTAMATQDGVLRSFHKYSPRRVCAGTVEELAVLVPSEGRGAERQL